jgi:hypothetical protein
MKKQCLNLESVKSNLERLEKMEENESKKTKGGRIKRILAGIVAQEE